MEREGLEEASVATETRKNEASPAAMHGPGGRQRLSGGESGTKCDRLPNFLQSALWIE